MKHFDFVVVGSGLAGLVSAYHASFHGRVALVSKSELDISNSYNAQGGVAVVISDEDSPESHIEDTLVAGRGLCDWDAVDLLVRNGIVQIRELLDRGVSFDRDQQGDLILGMEGGHSHRRILHADGDATGRVLTSFMLQEILKRDTIVTFEFTTVTQILVENNRCRGVQALDFKSGENIIFHARAVILATGGFSRIYSRTTNPHTATGDGIALAWEAGAAVADMEFIQFHPTALSLEGEDAYLISEAVRGEGALLLDSNGDRFMTAIHPLAELAPRDVVASAIFNKIREQGKPVFLSLRTMNPDAAISRFNTIYNRLKQYGLDLTKDLIPIAPAAHYSMGGIRTDLWGQTTVCGLFACGEVASTGVMGANRLASNSLLECLVYGRRVVEKAILLDFPDPLTDQPVPVFLNNGSDFDFLSCRNRLSELMSNNAGMVRNSEEMEEALRQIDEMTKQSCIDEFDYNHLKIRNLTTVCRLITQSAIARKESRGGHVRADYPDESAHELRHILQQQGRPLYYETVRTKSRI